MLTRACAVVRSRPHSLPSRAVPRTIDELPLVDSLDPRFGHDPDTLRDELAGLAAEEPVVRSPYGVMLLRHADVAAALRDPRLRVVGLDLLHIQGVTSGPTHEWFRQIMFSHDGPAHLRLRRLVARAFTPRAIDRHEPTMRALVSELALAGGTFDVVEVLATPYPIRVMAHMLGGPEGEVAAIEAWTEVLGYTFGVQLAEHVDEVDTAVVELGAYLHDLLDRVDPTSDELLSTLLTADGEDRLTRDEVVVMVGNLLLAGYDTTRHMLGNLLYALAIDGLWGPRLADPTEARAAVEEAGRLLPAAPGVTRIAVEDLELAGVAIPAGSVVSLSSAVANRDPAAYADPARFDAPRDGEPAHSLFGAGPHHCLGASLARKEMQVALEVLAHRWATVEVAGPVTWSPPNLGIVGPTSLPLRVT